MIDWSLWPSKFTKCEFSCRILTFLHARSVRVTTILSSVCGTPALCQNSWTYHQNFSPRSTVVAFLFSRGSTTFIGVSLCVCVCAFVRSITQKNEWSQSLQTWYREWPRNILQAIWFWRLKGQRSRSHGHKVQKHIEGDRVAGVSLHLYRVLYQAYSEIPHPHIKCSRLWNEIRYAHIQLLTIRYCLTPIGSRIRLIEPCHSTWPFVIFKVHFRNWK